MTQNQSKPAAIKLFAIGGGFAILLAGCGEAAETADSNNSSDLPQDYADGIVAVYDPQHPPSYFIDEQGDMVGTVLDFTAGLEEHLGVDITVEQAGFDAIISGIQGGRYDISYFHGSPDRVEALDIIAMQNTGSSILVPDGNPNDLDMDRLCGYQVGTTQGGTESLDLLPDLQADCEDRGEEPIEELSFSGPNETLFALQNNRLDAMFEGAPYNGYIMTENPGEFEVTETFDLSGNSGFATRNDDELTQHLLDAAQELFNSGDYQTIAQEWEIEELMLEEPFLMTGE